MLEIIPFTADHLAPAVTLFQNAYREARVATPHLPGRALEDSAWIRAEIESHLGNPGVAAIDRSDGALLGYMLTAAQFDWKGQRCAIVPEIAHGAVAGQKQRLYQRMYMHLAQQWVDDGTHIHLIGHLAHDAVLRETLYQLGFGAILAERIRDLSPITTDTRVAIIEERDIDRLVDLELEHNRYYPKSPIFLNRAPNAEEARADLEETLAEGAAIFVVYDGQQPAAYLTVGTSSADGEGLLLRNTNTAQVKGAYARPAYRGQGLGVALLQRAIDWARDHDYDRLMVEHETANIFGGNFWRKHFAPYLHFSMRYVDNTL